MKIIVTVNHVVTVNLGIVTVNLGIVTVKTLVKLVNGECEGIIPWCNFYEWSINPIPVEGTRWLPSLARRQTPLRTGSWWWLGCLGFRV